MNCTRQIYLHESIQCSSLSLLNINIDYVDPLYASHLKDLSNYSQQILETLHDPSFNQDFEYTFAAQVSEPKLFFPLLAER